MEKESSETSRAVDLIKAANIIKGLSPEQVENVAFFSDALQAGYQLGLKVGRAQTQQAEE